MLVCIPYNVYKLVHFEAMAAFGGHWFVTYHHLVVCLLVYRINVRDYVKGQKTAQPRKLTCLLRSYG